MTFPNNGDDYVKNIKSLDEKGLVDLNRNSKYWGFVPVEHTLLSPLYKIYKEESKLLDLGCGAGNVLRYAENIGYDVTGVEMDDKFSKYLLDYKWNHCNMENLKEDFYKKYDVIYSYVCIKENVDEFLRKIIDSMRSGAYLLTPHTELVNDKLIRIDNFCYQKQ